jgi:predicted nucleotide-binding protein
VVEGRQFPDPTALLVRIISGPAVDPAGLTRTERWTRAVEMGQDVTDEYIREAAGSGKADSSRREPTGDPRKVMVIYGRDNVVQSSIFHFLRDLSLQPLEWSQLVALTGTATPYIGDVLDAAFNTARAAVVVLSPDEEVRLREPLRGEDDPADPELQSRPNVFFELVWPWLGSRKTP